MSNLVLTEDQRFSRDTTSMALINTNIDALQNRKRNKDIERRLKIIESKVTELNTSVARVLEILKAESING